MKILERTETRLIIGERGLDARHWGYLATVLGGAGLMVMLSDEEPLIVPAVAVASVFLVLGLFAALFMRKSLTHILDRASHTLRVEYPVRMCTRLDVEEYRLDDIEAVATDQRIFLRSEASPGPSHRVATTQMGFHYLMGDGTQVESGLYSSVHEEIEAVVRVLGEFLDLRA